MGLEPTTTRITISAAIEYRRGFQSFDGKLCGRIEHVSARVCGHSFPRAHAHARAALTYPYRGLKLAI
jgi:hypothetical protein